MIHSVITGEMSNPGELEAVEERKLTRILRNIFSEHKHEFYRHNSFQVYIKDSRLALRIALLSRTAAICLQGQQTPANADIRIGIGIGSVDSPVRILTSAKGEAFTLSAKALEGMKRNQGGIYIVTGNKMANFTFGVMADYINSVIRLMTAKQAEVIFQLLKGYTQQQVSYKLKKSKSTISQHVTAARWDEIENLLNKYQSFIHIVSSD